MLPKTIGIYGVDNDLLPLFLNVWRWVKISDMADLRINKIKSVFPICITNMTCTTVWFGPQNETTWRAIVLQWRHNGRHRVSNHQPRDCLLNRLFRRRTKKIKAPRHSAQMASYAENVSIWWHHHHFCIFTTLELTHSVMPISTVEDFIISPPNWNIPDSKVHGANMGPIWGRQDPGGPHVSPMDFAILDSIILVVVRYCIVQFE